MVTLTIENGQIFDSMNFYLFTFWYTYKVQLNGFQCFHFYERVLHSIYSCVVKSVIKDWTKETFWKLLICNTLTLFLKSRVACLFACMYSKALPKYEWYTSDGLPILTNELAFLTKSLQRLLILICLSYQRLLEVN